MLLSWMAIQKKLNKRKCKVCKTTFQKTKPLEMVCSYKCAIEYGKIQQEKKVKSETKSKKIETHSEEYKRQLQSEINKLARQIDERFGYKCIDCGKDYGKLVHGAHFRNVQGNENIRFNLHNIHSARAYCNTYSSEHKVGYAEGLEKRYGLEYLNRVINLSLEYPSIKLLPVEIHEKLKIVRKLNRDFQKMEFSNSIKARDLLNNLIGIYK